MSANEQDRRVGLLNSFLTCPHRNLEAVWPLHAELRENDPLFYQQLAAWYAKKGEVRDHVEAFTAALAVSTFPGHRDIGLALLRELEPYRVLRVVDWIKGTKKVIYEDRPRTRTRTAAAGSVQAPAGKRQIKETVRVGLGLTRGQHSLETEVRRYLHEREADKDWFDAAVLGARHAMRRLYQRLHVKPGARAQAILFDNQPPTDSKLFALRKLAEADSPEAQARTIIDYKIPYRVAATLVQAMTPTVLLALIEVMSPQELMNNLGSLQRRGAMDNADLKAAIEAKLVKARTGKRVAALKGKEAKKAAPQLDADVAAQLDKVADAQVRGKARITEPLALLIDKSGSMQTSIELGKQIVAMLSAICDADLYVYAFDTVPYRITPGVDLHSKRVEMAEWERAFLGIRAGGGTCCGAPLAMMAQQRQRVERVVIVTDGAEHSYPTFADAYRTYAQRMGVQPTVTMVRVPGEPDGMTARCKTAGVELDVWDAKSDASNTQYALTQLLTLVNKASKFDLLLEVMSTKLPQRRTA